MKTKIILALFLIFSLIFSVTVTADCGMRWYVKRNGTRQPKLDEAQKIIYEYNGTFLNQAVSDDSDEKVLYLTFDVGYENGNVEKILDALKENGAQAAFFVLSHFVRKNTDLVLRMINEGHLVCNHTANHINLSRANIGDAEKSIKRLEEIYFECTGKNLDPFFRFPEGAYSEESLKTVQSLGYKSVFWSLAYADWDEARQPGESFARNLLLSNTHNGAVILLHPTSTTNAKILPSLIADWRSMGYRFGSLYEL